MINRAKLSKIAILLVGIVLVFSTDSNAQFDPSWYSPGNTYIKLGVAADGVYRVDLRSGNLDGVDISGVNASSYKIFEDGVEIPILHDTSSGRNELVFIGERNDGSDEDFAYGYNTTRRSSAYHSLYSDTTYYWLTWDGASGLRYNSTTSQSGAGINNVQHSNHLESELVYHNGSSSDTASPVYVLGEGYIMHTFSQTPTSAVDITKEFEIAIDQLNSSQNLDFNLRMIGGSSSRHLVNLYLELTRGGSTEFYLIDTADWSGYTFVDLTGSIPASEIPSGTSTLKVKVEANNAFGGNPNRSHVDFIDVTFNRNLSAQDGQLIFNAPNGSANSYQLSGFPGGNLTAFHPSTSRSLSFGGSSFGATASSASTYLVSQDDNRFDPGSVKRDIASDLAATSNSSNYIIITTPFLRNTAETHANYRQSPTGGSHQVLVVEVQDIFDQFDYGRKSPIAIQRFITHAFNNWSTAPENVLLWGDTIYAKPGSVRPEWEVPCFGKSCSDSWLALNTQGTNDYIEAVSIGRISARTIEEGQTFINKIQNYESQPLSDWQKRFIWMTGGSNLSEQNRLNGYALDWGDRSFSNPIGGDTLNFFKSDDSALDPTFIDSVDTAISNGSALLMFFGHSATQTWSIVTNPPEQFNNPDELPLVFSLGCYTGAYGSGAGVDQSEQVFGERLVIGSLNGAIAHYGGSAASFITPAGEVADPAFDIMFLEGERVLGKVIKENKRRYITRSANPSALSISTTLQYNLLGDPATILSIPSSPDLHVTPAHVSLNPFAPSPSSDDSLTVNVRLTNRGLLPSTDVVVELRHWDPANQLQSYRKTVPAYSRPSNMFFRIPIDEGLVGENRYQIILDPDNFVSEEVETNNTTEKTQIIFGSGIFLALPAQDGIVNSLNTTLSVVVASTQGTQTPILFQMSSNPDYSGAQEFTTTGELLAEWDVSGMQNGTTYYWRATVDDPSLPPGWKEGRFTVRTDLTDSGFFQQDPEFSNNEFGNFLDYDGQNFEFDDFKIEVQVSELGQLFVAGNQIYFLLGMGVSVFDRGTGVKKGDALWFHPDLNNTDPPEVDAQRYQDVVDTAIDGDYIIFSTRFLQIPAGEPLTEPVRAVLRNLGSVEIDQTTYDDAYIGIFKKGEGLVTELLSPGVRQNVDFSYDLPFNFGQSFVLSRPLGPTSRWISGGIEASLQNPNARLGLLAADLNGVPITDTTWVDQGNSAATIDLLSIDASTRPQIKLKTIFEDASQQSTPQLVNWYATFDLVPELMIDPAQFRLSANEVSEGEEITVFNQITNLSDSEATEVIVKYEIVDRNNVLLEVAKDTLDMAIAGGQMTEIQRSLSTIGFAGRNQLIVTVQQGSFLEAIEYNNTVVGSFTAEGDIQPPEVTVLIDGIEFSDDPRVITNLNDESVPFVSARPTIEVVIKDDNKYLALEDTTNLTVRLDETVVEYALPNVSFIPGTAEKNEARFVYDAEFARDSTHTLVITGRDASGNASPTSEDPYRVNFRVQTTTEVKNMFNYPNPMNSFTTFAFQLRGLDAAVVDDLRLRIYTVNGRLIREFDIVEDPSLLDSGVVQVGWNKFSWDGTDEDGDQVANGVYLYKVILQADGKDMTDDFEIEKIAVIR